MRASDLRALGRAASEGRTALGAAAREAPSGKREVAPGALEETTVGRAEGRPEKAIPPAA